MSMRLVVARVASWYNSRTSNLCYACSTLLLLVVRRECPLACKDAVLAVPEGSHLEAVGDVA